MIKMKEYDLFFKTCILFSAFYEHIPMYKILPTKNPGKST